MISPHRALLSVAKVLTILHLIIFIHVFNKFGDISSLIDRLAVQLVWIIAGKLSTRR